MSVRRLRVRIEGRVQGVFFREFTRRRAQGLGLQGWVRNCSDGSVEAVFEGEEKSVEQALEAVRRGPELARVLRTETFEETPMGQPKGFEVRR